jgi:hypothetical protein
MSLGNLGTSETWKQPRISSMEYRMTDMTTWTVLSKIEAKSGLQILKPKTSSFSRRFIFEAGNDGSQNFA